MVEPILGLTAHFIEKFTCGTAVTLGNGFLKILLSVYYSDAFMSLNQFQQPFPSGVLSSIIICAWDCILCCKYNDFCTGNNIPVTNILKTATDITQLFL